MVLKEFIQKTLDYNPEKVVVIDNKNGTFSTIIDIIETTDGYGTEIVSVKIR